MMTQSRSGRLTCGGERDSPALPPVGGLASDRVRMTVSFPGGLSRIKRLEPGSRWRMPANGRVQRERAIVIEEAVHESTWSAGR
jgi:hypothetical protein